MKMPVSVCSTQNSTGAARTEYAVSCSLMQARGTGARVGLAGAYLCLEYLTTIQGAISGRRRVRRTKVQDMEYPLVAAALSVRERIVVQRIS